MKILVIGDIHGREIWKQIVNRHLNDIDKIIFVGDYFDSFDYSYDRQQNNFEDICVFKRKYSDIVDLLIGNHDYHYFNFFTGIPYAGHSIAAESVNSYLLEKNKDILKIACIYDKYLFTHAGVSEVWYNSVKDTKGLDITLPLDIQLNDLFEFKPDVYRFTQGRTFSVIGNDVTQTPIWIRPEALSKCLLEDYIHVVGHTYKKKIKGIPLNTFEYYDNKKIILTDRLPYYCIIDTENNTHQIFKCNF